VRHLRAELPPDARSVSAARHKLRELASEGLFLGPPTQPEIGELRDWICDEVVRQAREPSRPRPWAPRTGIRESSPSRRP